MKESELGRVLLGNKHCCLAKLGTTGWEWEFGIHRGSFWQACQGELVMGRRQYAGKSVASTLIDGGMSWTRSDVWGSIVLPFHAFSNQSKPQEVRWGFIFIRLKQASKPRLSLKFALLPLVPPYDDQYKILNKCPNPRLKQRVFWFKVSQRQRQHAIILQPSTNLILTISQ